MGPGNVPSTGTVGLGNVTSFWGIRDPHRNVSPLLPHPLGPLLLWGVGPAHPPAPPPSSPTQHTADSANTPPRPRPCPWTLGVGGGAGGGQGGETSYSSAQSQPLPVLPDSPDKLLRMECDLRMSVPSLDDKSPGRQMPGPCRTVTWAPCMYPLVPQSPHPTPGSRAGRPCAWGDRADRAS